MQRRTSLHRARRVSAAIASRLSYVFDKSPTDPNTGPYRHSLISNSSSSASALTVTLAPDIQAECDAAIPAEPPTEYHLITEHEFPHLRALRVDENLGDGIWLCCFCAHENILRHYRGRFPFKFLACARCQRLLCAYCHTSDILRPWAFGLIHAPPVTGPNQVVRFCQMCPRCGLSHRAEQEGGVLDFYGVRCAGCGTSGFGDWKRFRIGRAEAYRRDPDRVWAELSERRAEEGVKTAIERRIEESGVDKLVSALANYTGDNVGKEDGWKDDNRTERGWEEDDVREKKQRGDKGVEQTDTQISAENDEPKTMRYRWDLRSEKWTREEVKAIKRNAELEDVKRNKELDEAKAMTGVEEVELFADKEAGPRLASEILDNQCDGFTLGFELT